MPGAFLAGLVFPLVAYMILPRESSRGRTALSLLPASLASLAPAVSFVKEAAASLEHPLAVVRLFFELIAYGTGMIVAGPLTTIHANAKGVGLFSGPSYMTAMNVSAVFAVASFGALVYRMVRGEAEERLELGGLLLLGITLYAGVTLTRGSLAGTKSVEWIAARTPQHYAASVPFVLAAAAAAGRLRIASEFFTRFRVVALGAAAIALVIMNGVVSGNTHAQRPERSARVVSALDTVLADLIGRVPEGQTAYIQNDDFPPTTRSRSRGIPVERFPGIGAYWALAHGPAVPSTGAPAPSSSAEAEKPPETATDPAHRPVRFVVVDPKILAAIEASAPSNIAALFVAPAVPTRDKAEVYAIAGANADAVEALDRAKRALARANDL
jgi:hypothetical protein